LEWQGTSGEALRKGLTVAIDAKKLKFGIGIAIIVGVVAWQAVSGFQQSKTYYVTVSELTHAGKSHERIRVGGVVEEGTIKRVGGQLHFRLSQDANSIPVVYVGTDTLPDTFVDGAQAVVEGEYVQGGDLRAEKIQAKCASKYEAGAPGGKGYPKPDKQASAGATQ
jgi:cytochrome c-type biogenesis protein CcmE